MAQGREPQNATGVAGTLRLLPPDLAFVLGFVALTVASIFLPVIRETPLRVLLGLPLILFIPGYVFVAALFPESKPVDSNGQTAKPASEDTRTTAPNETNVSDRIAKLSAGEGSIDGIERVALSFGLSIAIVPLIGLVLNFTPWGIRLVPIVVSLTGFILAATIIATQRRRALPPEVRFQVPYRDWIRATRTELFKPDSKTDAALNVLLVVSILLATASVGYAVAVPAQGESFTEFYLLTENAEGELVADNYPQEFVAGENQTLTVGIGNQEYDQVAYSVVVAIQDVRVANNSTTVQSQQRLQQFNPQLDHNETWQRQHTVAPTMTGNNLRLTYLLYRDAPPATPTAENAYRELHLWVNVTAS
jgi:uncharacterized membrane protein